MLRVDRAAWSTGTYRMKQWEKPMDEQGSRRLGTYLGVELKSLGLSESSKTADMSGKNTDEHDGKQW